MKSKVVQEDQEDYVYQGEKPWRPWKQKIYHYQEWWTTNHTINYIFKNMYVLFQMARDSE